MDFKKFKAFFEFIFYTVIIFALFTFFQHSLGYGFADPDAFYHAKMAELVVGQGTGIARTIGDTFPWMPFASWGHAFADQHYLFHWILSAFVGSGGDKGLHNLSWAIVVLSTLATLAFILTLQTFNIKAKWLWLAVFLLGSVDFLFRINVVKANTLSLVILFLGIIATIKKKYFWLIPLSFLFAWSYGVFILLPLMLGLWLVINLFAGKKIIWQPFVYSTIGMALGIILHPQGANLLPSLYNQIFQAGLGSLGSGQSVPVGQEWYPYSLQGILNANLLILPLWIASAILYIKEMRKSFARDLPAVWLFALSLVFFILMIKSKRFVEYWAPFATLFIAYAINPYLKKLDWHRFRKTFQEFWQFKLVTLIVIGAIAAAMYSNVHDEIGYLSNPTRADLYKNAAQYMAIHSKPGDVVFNTQWDEFPQLFYWDDTNAYIVGEDPTFLYISSPELYWKWRSVADDRIQEFGTPEHLHDLLANDFHAKYLFTQMNRNSDIADFLDNIIASSDAPRFSLAYRDQKVAVYEVLP